MHQENLLKVACKQGSKADPNFQLIPTETWYFIVEIML